MSLGGGVNLGYAISTLYLVAAISLLLPYVSRVDQFNIPSKTEQSTLPACSALGLCCGALVWGGISDRIGRRQAFLYTCVVSGFFGFASAFSQSFEALVALRFLASTGLGGNLPIDLGLFIEFLGDKQRASSSIALNMFIPFGALFAVGLAWLVLERLGRGWYLVLLATPHFILALSRWGMPESPRWLLARGDVEGTARVLEFVANYNGCSDLLSSPEQLRDSVALWTHANAAGISSQAGAVGKLNRRGSTFELLLKSEFPTLPRRIASRVEGELQPLNSKVSKFTSLLKPPLRATTVPLWGVWFFTSLGKYGFDSWTPTILQSKIGPSFELGTYQLMAISLACVPFSLLIVHRLMSHIGRPLTYVANPPFCAMSHRH